LLRWLAAFWQNGGPSNGYNGNMASNMPLRGRKNEYFEGGIRGSGFIVSWRWMGAGCRLALGIRR
jgi:hypothetical protein